MAAAAGPQQRQHSRLDLQHAAVRSTDVASTQRDKGSCRTGVVLMMVASPSLCMHAERQGALETIRPICWTCSNSNLLEATGCWSSKSHISTCWSQDTPCRLRPMQYDGLQARVCTAGTECATHCKVQRVLRCCTCWPVPKCDFGTCLLHPTHCWRPYILQAAPHQLCYPTEQA